MAYKKMPVAEWISVEDNPIQRDTERHAAKAKHLLTPHPTHSFVFAAELPSGKLIKLDGHTRALLWKRGDVAAPTLVQVGIFPVENRAEAERLYKVFDSREALETMRDKVSGAFNKHSFAPQSGLVGSGSITSALRMAHSVAVGRAVSWRSTNGKGGKPATDVYDLIKDFAYELHALDGFGLGAGRLPAGGVAAFILSFRKHGHKVTPFWQSVFAKGGEKSAGQKDGVQCAVELLMVQKNYGGAASSELCCRLLASVEKWLNDEWVARLPRALDMAGYLAGATTPLERLIKRKAA